MESYTSYVTVLDYNDGTVTQFEIKHMKVSDLQCEYVEDLLISKGFSLSNIEYMVHSNPVINKRML